jgi:hypothetical protein
LSLSGIGGAAGFRRLRHAAGDKEQRAVDHVDEIRKAWLVQGRIAEIRQRGTSVGWWCIDRRHGPRGIQQLCCDNQRHHEIRTYQGERWTADAAEDCHDVSGM